MIKIQAGLCIGCGRCISECPQQAISIVNGQARINQELCNNCGLCITPCPGGAIVYVTPVSAKKLTTEISSLKQKTDDLIAHIKAMQYKSNVKDGERS